MGQSKIIQFFRYEHLPEDLAASAVSKTFCDLAESVDMCLPDNIEKQAALRKLLEAKDCAVRATIYKV